MRDEVEAFFGDGVESYGETQRNVEFFEISLGNRWSMLGVLILGAE